MDVIPLDADTPPDLLVSWHALRSATGLELDPHIPPATLDEALPSSLSDDSERRVGWLALDAGAVVGFALLELPQLDNPHLALLNVRVDLGRRRAGVATSLAILATRAAIQAGRRTLLVEALDGTAGAAMCEALGGVAALGDTASTLDVRGVDPALLEAWIAQRQGRAAGYSLVRWEGRCPDELLEGFARLRGAMDTAPKGQLDLTIEWSAASVRAAEEAHVRCRQRNLVLCARDDTSGELIAVTDVLAPLGRPTLAIQEDTVVRPDHRGRGIGRWIKAEMLRWLAVEAPRLAQIVTWNATENTAMRAINTELGFVPIQTWTEWQFDTDKLLQRLENGATD
jgi:GNAT superfamily N-acetyltransferase